jgi:hypothetical protein
VISVKKYTSISYQALVIGLLAVLYLFSIIVVPRIYALAIPILIFGTILLYVFSPTVAFVYSFIYVIDPTSKFELAFATVVPLFCCFIYVLSNIRRSIDLIRSDRILKGLVIISLLFTFYQIFISFLFLSGEGLLYVARNIKYWAGFWIIIPSYIFTLGDRRMMFLSIILVSLITISLYYLSFFGIIDFFQFKTMNRSEGIDTIIRYFSFDFRQIMKIFVYLVPLLFFFPTNNKILTTLSIFLGISVFIAIMIAVLRNEMFYLFLGSLLAFILTFRRVNSIGKINIFIIIVSIISVVFIFFPDLVESLSELINLTFNSANSGGNDESLDHRMNVQLPILLDILKSNILFGAGNYAVSIEATSHYLMYDIPIIGGFAVYGIFGMCLYYARFLNIFEAFSHLQINQDLYRRLPFECLLLFALFAYFVTMVTFRGIHINMELAFDFGMAEFGLFLGVYFGLIRILTEQKTGIV